LIISSAIDSFLFANALKFCLITSVGEALGVFIALSTVVLVVIRREVKGASCVLTRNKDVIGAILSGSIAILVINLESLN
jgi:hypothetical protein